MSDQEDVSTQEASAPDDVAPEAATPEGSAPEGSASDGSAQEGDVVTGKVVKLQDFGAFVEIDEQTTGLVHISEVSREFVDNIHAYLTEGQEVEVKIVGVKEDGRIDLSIKRAEPDWSDEARPRPTAKVDKEFNQRLRKFMHQSDMIQGEVRKRKRAI